MMKKAKRISLIISLIAVLLLLGNTTYAWLCLVNNRVDANVSQASVVQQYFHCGTGTQDDPFVITRPIHYYHLVELYQRRSLFETGDYYYQLGYLFEGESTYKVYAYDEFGNTDGTYSDTLNMMYYSGSLSLIPVGTSTHPFGGHFDGKGLTIDNLSIVSWEQIGDRSFGSCDIGVFGYVKSTAEIHDLYISNLTLSLSGADAAAYAGSDSSAIHDTNGDGVKDTISVGYVIGHLLQYTNAQDRDYQNNTVRVDSEPISNVYVNSATVTGGDDGTANLVSSAYGFIGYVDTVDAQNSVAIRNIVEGLETHGAGDESWGGSIDMTALFNRICTIDARAKTNTYPSVETIVGSSTSNGYPSTMATTFSAFGSRNYEYWSAMSDAGTNVFVNTTGGAFIGSRSDDWTYLYGQTQTTATTTKTKTGAIVNAYYLYDNGAYVTYDGTDFTGAQISKLGSKWIRTEETVTQATVSAKYYMLIDDQEYYLAADGTTGVKAVRTAAAANVWVCNDADEFYTVIGGKEYYLYYDGLWSLSQSTKRYAIGDGNGHFLGGSIGEVHNEANEADGAIWQLTSLNGNTSFYFTSGGQNYYLTYDGGLTVKAATPANAPVWTRQVVGGNVRYYYNAYNIHYYLTYDNGWKAVITNGIKIGSDNHYLKITKNGDDTFTVNDALEGDATIFQITENGENSTIIANINGVGYYLSNNGTDLTVSSSAVYWNADSSHRFSRAVTFSQTEANGTYYLMYHNGWRLGKLSGYKITSDESHYLSLSDNTIVNQGAAYATVWYLNAAANTTSIYTVSGTDVCYLSYDTNGLCIASSPLSWTKNGQQYYVSLNGDNLYICYSGKWLLQPQTSYYIHDAGASPAHYLTYRNTATIDGVQSEACSWVIKENSGSWQIYTYIGTRRYFLCMNGAVLAISTASSSWSKDSKGYYFGDGYYLTFDAGDAAWKAIKMTASIKLHYDETVGGVTTPHYLLASGTGLADVANSASASMWYVTEGNGPIFTYVGQTQYYLTYRWETFARQSSDGETSTLTGAYRKVVPCISQTNNTGAPWSKDGDGKYYITIQGIKFYLIYDTDAHTWALEEFGGYQIKFGDDYLTLNETATDFTASTVTFTLGSLMLSETENYQWHIENGKLYTLIGGTVYYLTYQKSNTHAQAVSVTETAPTDTLFEKDGSNLKCTVDGVTFRMTNIPEEYTVLEYIQSDGSEYIDLGVHFNPATDRVVLTAALDEPTSARDKYLLAPKTWESSAYKRFALAGLFQTAFTIGFGNQSTGVTNFEGISPDNNFHTWEYDDYTFTLDDTYTLSYGSSYWGEGQTAELYLFYDCYQRTTRGRVSGLQYYRNGELILNLVPVRNRDGVVGLYNTVDNTFYTKTGTGSLYSELPEGYTEIEYVQSDGTAYINLNVAFTPTDKIILVAANEESNTVSDKYLLAPSSWDGGGNRRFAMAGKHASAFTIGFGNTSTGSTAITRSGSTIYPNNNAYTWIYDNYQFTMPDLDGSRSFSSSNWGGGSTANLRLFYGYNAPTRGKVYNLIYYKNGSLVLYLVPAKNSSGAVGFYNKVDGTFYTNSSSGTLNAGPTIAQQTPAQTSIGGYELYMIPENGYTSIASGNTYMTVDTNRNIGSATKNAANLYEYHRFIIENVSGGKYITAYFGGTKYYLTTNDSGTSVAQKGVLSFTATPVLWQVEDGNKYYHTIGTEKYYLLYDSTKGWMASPALVQINFRYILSNGKYLIVNDALNGVTYKTTYSNTDESIRWFVDGQTLYSERNDVKYYLSWSASSGFGVTTTKAQATSFNIGSNTVTISYAGFTFYIVYDSTGWNVVAEKGDTIQYNVRTSSSSTTYARYLYFNGSTVSVSTSSTIWYFSDSTHQCGNICTTRGGIVYFLDTNGTTVTAAYTSSPKSFENWGGTFACKISGVFYVIFIDSFSSSYTPTLYVRSTERNNTGFSGSIKLTIWSGNYILQPTSPYSGTYSISTRSVDTSTTLVNTSSGTLSDSYNYMFVFVDPQDLGNGIYSGWLWCNITGSSKYIRGNGSFSFSSSKASTREWFYDSYNHTVYFKANGTGTTYYLNMGSSGASMKGTQQSTAVDMKFYPSRSSALTESTLGSSAKTILYADSYVSGMTPQVISLEQTTESYYAIGNGVTGGFATAPVTLALSEQTPNRAQTLRILSGIGAANEYTVTETPQQTVYSITPSSITAIENIQNPTVSLVATTDRLYATATANYKRGTYLPLRPCRVDENDATSAYVSDFRAYYKNTGYIVGGAYSAASGSGRGDIRVSRYSIGNISDSYNRSTKQFTNLYTFNDSGTSPVLINPNANAYTEFAETKEKFLDILSQDSSYVYGLHFMDAQISTDHIMYAESVMINNKTYVNYEMPESSIDFNVIEQGHIILYAGDYYTSGNSCFFSLHQIYRDSNQHITAIREISEIYTKPGLTDRGYYIYKFTDGTYTNANGSYTGATTLDPNYTSTPVFKMKWLTNPTNGRDFSNDYIYYFEIPCNQGEYCLGSVPGQDGGYLLYLDIAANGVHGMNYNQAAAVSDDPLFTQIGYLPSGTWINSLLNIAYTVPVNNGNSSFSIKVNYDPNTSLYDQKYNTTCNVFDIYIKNTTGYPMDLYVLLVDDDDDVENDYNYRYRVYYNDALYTLNDAFDPDIGAFYATATLNLSVQ